MNNGNLTPNMLWHFVDPKREPVGFTAKNYKVAYCGVYFKLEARQLFWESCPKCLETVIKMPDEQWRKEWLERIKLGDGVGIVRGRRPIHAVEAEKKLPLFLEVCRFFKNHTERHKVKVNLVKVYRFTPPTHGLTGELWRKE